MPKLVVLSEGLTGRSHEIKLERTTIGRLEDNTFHIPEQSVSSHHCEIVQRGSEIFIRDLNSTNGTFVNGQQISAETVLKPGTVFRLGKVEVRLEAEGAAAAAPKKLPAQTTALPTGGVKLNELDQIGKTVTFDKTSPFSKKARSGNMFMIGMIVAGVLILGVIVWLIFSFGGE